MAPLRRRITQRQIERLISLGTLAKQAFKLRVRRINRWMLNGFSRQEALNLTALKSVNKWTNQEYTVAIPTTRPYTKAMLRHRASMLRQAKKDGITAKEYWQRVYNYYKDNGWLTPDGKIDYWAELRHYQRQTDYHWAGKRPPYDPNKPHKKKDREGGIDYSHTRKQAKKYRSKGQATTKFKGKPPTRDKLLETARTSLRNAKTPKQREIAQRWIDNLERSS